MYLLGIDIGSSSVKATLLDAGRGKVVSSASSPETELEITALQAGWAEQNPDVWWEHVRNAIRSILAASKRIDPQDIKAVGISYQMHGLVLVDKMGNVLRPSIIWCDSRAVEIGEKAFHDLSNEVCLKHFLNSPGNFTASKMKWVKENEPDIYNQVHKMMLPGDYIAARMTGKFQTTPSGLSEGIMWDFQKQKLADILLDYYGISTDLIPEVVPTFSIHGEMTQSASEYLGLAPGTLISYRAGDQPNNALSLNVLNPGEIAATAGTSGVIYGVGEMADYDPQSRVNTFVHVNHSKAVPRYGVLLCLNGTGIQNSWLKHNAVSIREKNVSYTDMNEMAASVPAGSEGVIVLPFGNGAERSLGNRDIGGSVHGLNFNIHSRPHLLRAAQEGIVFALNYGIGIMRKIGVDVSKVRAGNANMFLSPIFREAFATVTEAVVELYNTDGSQGAARGAGIGAGIYSSPSEAFEGLEAQDVIEPDTSKSEQYKSAYNKWLRSLDAELQRR